MTKLWPRKYYRGLSKRNQTRRKKEIQKFGAKGWKDSSAYKGFATDKGIKTKSSSYTKKFQRRFPKAKTLKQKAEATGVPLSTLRASYNRGLAAWRTGHRPGASQQQWGYARVHSLLTCGKTYKTTDSDLVRKAKASSASAKRYWSTTCH